MTKQIQHIKTILIGILLLLGSVLFVVTMYYRQAATEYIHATVPLLLQEAVQINAKNKMANIPFSGFAYSPEKVGTTEIRTFKTSDTTFTYNYKIVDIETELLRSQQSFLLLAGDLRSSDIRAILDSLLQHRNIQSEITIGITASFYKKLNDWTPQKDTANRHFNYATSLTKQGLFEDINYQVQLKYPFATLWRLMPHTLIQFLFLLELLILSLLIGNIIKRKYSKRMQIASLAALKEIKMTGQVLELFEMFTDNNGKVNKEAIKKKFWPQSENPTTNMTTLVDRLRKKLAETGQPCTIITDPEDDKFYRLIPVDKTDV